MKTESAKQLRNKSSSELKAELLKARREQFKLRLIKAGGEMRTTHRIKLARRQIARMSGILAERLAFERKEGKTK